MPNLYSINGQISKSWLVVGSFLAAMLSAHSETITWSGNPNQQTAQNWGEANLWNPQQIPGAGDRVILPNGTKANLDVDSSILEWVVGEDGAGKVAIITGEDKSITVSSLTQWNNGVLNGTGFLTLSEQHDFIGKAEWNDWTVQLSGSGTALLTSFRTSRNIQLDGTLTAGRGVSFGGSSPGELLLRGTLDMNAQTGAGTPPGKDTTSTIDSINFNHSGTLKATRGKWIIGSEVLSVNSAKTMTGTHGHIEFNGGGQFGLSEAHQFDPAPDSIIRFTGVTRPYQLANVVNISTNGIPVYIENTKLQSASFNGGTWLFDAETLAPIELNKGELSWRGGTIRGGFSQQAGTQLTIGNGASSKQRLLDGNGSFLGMVDQFKDVTLASNVVIGAEWKLHNFANIKGNSGSTIALSGVMKHSGATSSELSIITPYLYPASGSNPVISNEGGILELRDLGPSSPTAPYSFILEEKVDFGAPALTKITGTRLFFPVGNTSPEGFPAQDINIEGFSATLENTLIGFKERGGTMEFQSDVQLAGYTVAIKQATDIDTQAEVRFSKGTIELLGTLESTDFLNDADDTLRISESFGEIPTTDAPFIIHDTTELTKPIIYFSEIHSNPLFNADVQWKRGIIEGNGYLTNNGKLLITGTETKRLQGDIKLFAGRSHGLLNDRGHITQVGNARLELGNGGTVINSRPIPFSNVATYEISGDGDIVPLPGTTGSKFENNGLLTKNQGFGTSIISVPFSNLGGVWSVSGTLRFSGPSPQIVIDPQTGTIDLSGNWRAAVGGVIQFAQTGALKLGTITGELTVSESGAFLNSIGSTLFSTDGELKVKGQFHMGQNSEQTLGGIRQSGSLETPHPKTTIEGRLRTGWVTSGAGTIEITPGGVLETHKVTITKDSSGNPVFILDGEQKPPSSETITPPQDGGGIFIRDGFLQGSGTARSPIQLGHGGIISPGKSPGQIHVGQIEFQSGSQYLWEVNNWGGKTGEHFDRIIANEQVIFSATPEEPVTIDVRTLTINNEAGPAIGWDPSLHQSWIILETTGSIKGFEPDAIRVNAPLEIAGAFKVEADTHQIRLIYTSSSNPYQDWIKQFFSESDQADPAKVAEDADFDEDGIPNLMEFAQNTDPTDPKSVSPLRVEVKDGELTLRFKRRIDRSDIYFGLEKSDNLVTWVAELWQDRNGEFRLGKPSEYELETQVEDVIEEIFIKPIRLELSAFYRLTVGTTEP